jgi:hypothetical protein
MKKILMLSILFSALNSFAGDTLTRAQVYNFSVGDTFDYRYYANNSYGGFDTSYSNTTISYTRYVVSNIYWSIDSSVKYIVRRLPDTSGFDTLTIDNIQGEEVILDTVWFNSSNGPNYYKIDSCPTYFGQTTNYITFFCCGPGWEEMYFGRGLGKVLDHVWGGEQGYYSGDSTVLIYYSGANGTFGNPIASHVTNITIADPEIKVFPTVNSGFFTVSIPDAIQFPAVFSLYDMCGKEIAQIILNKNNQEIGLPGLSKGVYLWKALLPGKSIQTGKIIVIATR